MAQIAIAHIPPSPFDSEIAELRIKEVILLLEATRAVAQQPEENQGREAAED